ncbi:MAG: hypothetical protein HOP30_14705 [Cyclobacteriaceae bacterium]|nr:hypothetical protein [Cyclobacteriaceae bacterium]
MLYSDCASLNDYIIRSQVDAVLWKAELLLAKEENPIVRNDRVADIARTIALLPADKKVVKDDYIRKISTDYKLNRKTFESIVSDHTVIERKKSDIVKAVRKNQVAELKGDPKTFPFFTELITINQKTDEKTFKGIKIDKVRFVQLLGSFGFTRYASEQDLKDGYTFIRVTDNVLSEVTVEEIKDFVEDFTRKQYDFTKCEYVDAYIMLNEYYDKMKTIFSKDLFARMRSEAPIIINRDTANECFLYYQNGFVRITKEGHELINFDKMDGSVWQKQMLNRKFEKIELQLVADEAGNVDFENSFTTDRPLGIFADFVWRICGQKQQRFLSLCTIIGYLVHDYYHYKLKCVELTDSTVSEKSEGRTGKTLLMQLLGKVRSYCEIPGKTFNLDDEKKYQLADRSTQVLHINDVNHKGRTRFEFEFLFNDITEGYTVRKMFQSPFIQRSKMVISTNKSLQIDGASSRDRIIEFEMSNFFSEQRSPGKYYGHWLAKDWDDPEWLKFDNFVCYCVQAFFSNGLIEPETINLQARKLLDGTSREFVDFMNDVRDEMLTNKTPWEGYTMPNTIEFVRPQSIYNFELDKKQLFDRFIVLYPDYKANHFTQKRFTDWLRKYGTLALGCSEIAERRSNTTFYIMFKKSES